MTMCKADERQEASRRLQDELEHLRRRVAELESQQRQEDDRIQYLAHGMESAGDSIVMTDIHGVIKYVNPAFTKLTGYARDEVIGKKPKVLRSGLHKQEFYDKLWETILQGKVWSGLVTNRRKDASLYSIELTISPVRNTAGDVIGFIAIQSDVTPLAREADQKDRRITKLQSELHVADLLGAGFTMCVSCKQVREEQQEWKEIDHYLIDRFCARISHGFCDSCARDLYPEIFGDE